MHLVGRTVGSLTIDERSPLSQRIREFRLSAGWTQKEFSKACGIHDVTIARLECLAKHEEMNINFVYAKRFKDCGLDLFEFPNIIIQYTKVKNKTSKLTPDIKIKIKGSELLSNLEKASQLVTKTKEEYSKSIDKIDKQVNSLVEQVANINSEIEKLTKRKNNLIEKINKSNKTIDSILESMIDEEKII